MVKRLFVFAMFFVLFAEAAQGGELEEIQRAIKEKGADWTAGETSISKLPPAERRKRLGAILEEGRPEGEEGEVEFVPGSLPFPEEFDWRDHDGYDWTTPIRNQESCLSCVAFGVIGALEGEMKVQFNAPQWDVDLSEQHLFSCGGGDCGPGMPVWQALMYLEISWNSRRSLSSLCCCG